MAGNNRANGQGSPATVITRRQTSVTYSSNSKTTIQLTRGLLYREIFLRLTGAPTLTGANNTRANTQLGDEWGVVKKIELIANGTTILFSSAGSDLKNLMRILYGQRPRLLPQIGDGATANPSLDSTVVIPFWTPRSVRPMDTILHSGEMSDLRLEITWGSFTDVNSAATAWTTNPTLEVGSIEQDATVLPNFLRRVLKIPVTIAAANSAFRYQLNTGPIYRGLILNALTTAPAEAAAQFSNVKVFSGPTTFMDISEPALYVWGNNRLRIPFEQEPNTTNFAQTSGQQCSAAVPQSWYNIDFAMDGYLSEALDTEKLGDTFLEFNAANACTINIITQELLRINRGGTGNTSPNA